MVPDQMQGRQGDVRLLLTHPVAQRLPAAAIPARLAYA